MPQEFMPIVLIAGPVVLVLVVFIASDWLKRSPEPKAAVDSGIPAGVELAPQRIMTESEAAFYNLLRLAAQDSYLVFSQIPLWCVLKISAKDPAIRQAFLTQIALKRLDFVLVHPGTLVAEKVVELEDQAPSSRQRRARNRLIDDSLEAAGIEVIRLSPQSSATVPELAAKLNLE